MTSPPEGGAGSERPSLRAEHRGSTRARFLEAALEVFEQHGFEGATVDNIAAAAGASRATFYLHFKSKEELVPALMQQIDEDVTLRYSELDTLLVDGSRDDLRWWLGTAMEWFSRHHALVRVLDQVRTLQPTIAAGVISWPFTDNMPRYLRRWPIEKQNEAKLRMWLAITLLTRLELLWPQEPSPQPADDTMLDILTDLWAASLKMP